MKVAARNDSIAIWWFYNSPGLVLDATIGIGVGSLALEYISRTKLELAFMDDLLASFSETSLIICCVGRFIVIALAVILQEIAMARRPFPMLSDSRLVIVVQVVGCRRIELFWTQTELPFVNYLWRAVADSSCIIVCVGRLPIKHSPF